METCVRGFSYMSESKVQLADLQFIEGGELERAWRTSRRERMKQREQKIWDEFVKENDIVKDVYDDDPYQFLDQLPESCLKEIMEKELNNMRKETAEELSRALQENVLESMQKGNGDSSSREEIQHPSVTFADDVDKDDCEMFHIFDDDPSGPEEDAVNGSMSPATVREKPREAQTQADSQMSPERQLSVENIPASCKSSENVTSVIESSIYCAKVKDLRIKINEEVTAIMSCLDRRDILSAAPETIGRMVKRSAEFCTRFNRIYMYQLQRQMHDIKRNINNNSTLPFAKHTQFQSQMVRIVSLHQSLLQSFQVFHRSVQSECMVREGAGAMRALLAAARDVSALCADVPRPKDFTAAAELYNDELLQTCDRLEQFAHEYSLKCEDYLKTLDRMMGYPKKTTKHKGKKRNFGAWTRNTQKSNTPGDTDARLSMYSLDTLRLNLNAKSSSSRDNQSSHGTSKKTLLSTAGYMKRAKIDKKSETPKSQKKSPKQSRRPLMRDPHAGQPRPPRPSRDIDIRTMVEAVEPCASSHGSRDVSPKASVRSGGRASPTPRGVQRALRSTHAPLVPAAPRRIAPRAPPAPRAPLSSRAPHSSRTAAVPSPVRKVQNARLNETKTDIKQSARSNQSTVRPLSSIKSDQETAADQFTPVCKIQCAMKKDIDDETHGHHHELRSSSPRENREGHNNMRHELKSSSPKENRDGHSRHELMSSSPKENRDGHLRHELTNASPRDRDGHICHEPKNASPRENRDGHTRHESTNPTPRETREDRKEKEKKERERTKMSTISPDRYEVTRVLKQLCSGDATGTDKICGAKNAQLVYVNGSGQRQPSTPQLLRILEETIQKKVPKAYKPASARGPDRYRLTFNIAEKTADNLFQYRTKFVQHMLTSALYANSAVGKPWEMIGTISERIIDELLLGCTKDMELRDLIQALYLKEITPPK